MDQTGAAQNAKTELEKKWIEPGFSLHNRMNRDKRNTVAEKESTLDCCDCQKDAYDHQKCYSHKIGILFFKKYQHLIQKHTSSILLPNKNQLRQKSCLLKKYICNQIIIESAMQKIPRISLPM